MSEWNIKASNISKRAHNPIRQIVDKLKVDPNAQKSFISLSVGDPTVFGNFNVHESANEAIKRQLDTFKHNGYPPAHGTLDARDAIARKYSIPDVAPLTPNDVLLANGCSGALDICVNVLCNPGQNILLPRPGFSLYKSLAEIREVEVRFYDLVPENNWQVDLKHLESLIDDKTACILVNNPSNPCGSVYPKEHLEAILDVAAKHHLPIIADEIYCDLVYKGNTFYPMASLTKDVPILAVGGLAKKWLVPGWRIGWILVHDRHDAFAAEVRTGLLNLSQVILGPNSVVQGALDDILHRTPQSFYEETISQLEHNAKLGIDAVSKIDGLTPVTPQGAMYMMVGIDMDKFKDISSDVEFSQKLVAEENVLVLPGQCFDYPNFIRIVITPPAGSLQEAYERMAEFCARHRK
ncbi:tyrosine aminotransferase [Lichtheimia corymbifera JMRC:FSU:9682]|uniref:Tyrosine aminotransferase n=1 Tax=Lichtheimia corymbifera JMRC:FSU:9682 TaxID=1263082 RepID=A0A068SBT5_9FUNG|nr:tyrosine aminotransferase [Lichtheimia corymbifera JMRC:FSU:9682]